MEEKFKEKEKEEGKERRWRKGRYGDIVELDQSLEEVDPYKGRIKGMTVRIELIHIHSLQSV